MRTQTTQTRTTRRRTRAAAPATTTIRTGAQRRAADDDAAPPAEAKRRRRGNCVICWGPPRVLCAHAVARRAGPLVVGMCWGARFPARVRTRSGARLGASAGAGARVLLAAARGDASQCDNVPSALPAAGAWMQRSSGKPRPGLGSL